MLRRNVAFYTGRLSHPLLCNSYTYKDFMPKPIAVALGDIHLDDKIWTKLSSITGDAELGYQSFLAVALRLKVPAVIAGDLFDVAKPPSSLVRLHRKYMDLCEAEGVPVLVLQGNHDKVQQAGVDKPVAPWATASHDWPTYVGDGRPFKLGEVEATALDYASMDVIEGQIRRVTTPLLFLHQAVRQALGFENAWNCDLDWVPPTVKLTVLGDIHKPMDMPFPDGRLACYTGAGHARDIDQTGPKSVIVINDDLTYYREPIPSRSIRKFYVKSVKDIDSVNAWLPTVSAVHNLPPLLWMAHTAEMAAHVSTVRSQVVSDGRVIVHTESLIDDAEVPIAGESAAPDDDISPGLLLSRIVDPEKDKELYGFLSELIDDRRQLTDVISSRKTAC